MPPPKSVSAAASGPHGHRPASVASEGKAPPSKFNHGEALPAEAPSSQGSAPEAAPETTSKAAPAAASPSGIWHQTTSEKVSTTFPSGASPPSSSSSVKGPLATTHDTRSQPQSHSVAKPTGRWAAGPPHNRPSLATREIKHSRPRNTNTGGFRPDTLVNSSGPNSYTFTPDPAKAKPVSQQKDFRVAPGGCMANLPRTSRSQPVA